MAKRSKRNLDALLEDGLCRLAFGDDHDAARLQALGHLPDADASSVSLYNIASVKWAKDGVEVKFCDRFKAMELLARLLADRDHCADGADRFCRALAQSIPQPSREEHPDL